MHRLGLAVVLLVPLAWALAALAASADAPVRATGVETAPRAPARELRYPAWSPDGRLLAFVEKKGRVGRLLVVSAAGGKPRVLTEELATPWGLTWSPDGRSLAFTSDFDIWRIDAATRRPSRVTSERERGFVMQQAWSPSGRTIAYAVFEGCFRCTRVYEVAVAGGERTLRADRARRPQWSPDATELVTSLPVVLVDVATGARRDVADGFAASWSPDGTELAYSTGGALVVVSRKDVATRFTWRGHASVSFPAIAPGGKRIAFVHGRRVSILVRATGERFVLRRSNGANDAPVWSRTGRLAFVADGTCGPRSQIDVVRADGAQRRVVSRACS